MAEYIYKPTGAVVTASEGRVLPAELFEPCGDKPKPRKRKAAKTAEKEADEEA